MTRTRLVARSSATGLTRILVRASAHAPLTRPSRTPAGSNRPAFVISRPAAASRPPQLKTSGHRARRRATTRTADTADRPECRRGQTRTAPNAADRRAAPPSIAWRSTTRRSRSRRRRRSRRYGRGAGISRPDHGGQPCHLDRSQGISPVKSMPTSWCGHSARRSSAS